jgi:hypothetical protein
MASTKLSQPMLPGIVLGAEAPENHQEVSSTRSFRQYPETVPASGPSMCVLYNSQHVCYMEPMHRLAPLALASVLGCATPVWRPAPLDPNVTRARAGHTYVWTFDDGEALGLLELSGGWRVEQAASALSPPYVLRSHAEAAPLSHLIVDEVSFSDADLSVRCRVLRGDGLCGMTFRVSDGAHYYAVRVDERTRKVALYRVAGAWQRLSESTIEPPGDQWHRIDVHVRGDEERVRWDGREVLNVQDGALPPVGAVGLLADGTAGASPSEYDDLEGRAL